MYSGKMIEFEEGCKCVETGVSKLKRILEEEEETSTTSPPFDPGEYMELYTTIYNMCSPPHPPTYSHRLYHKYHDILEHYASKTVLPSVEQKHDEYLLRELSRRWDHYKVFVKWLSHFFHYLERFFIPAQRNYSSLVEVAIKSFRDRVYLEIHSTAKDVVIALIHKEREGEQIDRALLKNVLDISVQCGMGTTESYEKDFERFLLQDTESYYSRKASSWIQQDSCPDYMIKSEESLQKEKERVTHYLHSSTEPKLVEILHKELLVSVAKQLLEKEHSGCSALLRDDKFDDLSRMYRLYHPIPNGLEPVAEAFRVHITREGNALVKQAQDAGKAEDLIRKIIELHDKYMVYYVTDCFKNHTLFHKVLKEAFGSFCHKKVAGSSSAELLATFCNNLLKNSGNDNKLSDEAIEATIVNVVKLLDYIGDKDLFAEFYRKKLARRLLFDRKVNEEHEISILSKLKVQHGREYTSKMEGMVKDMELAKEFQKGFKGCLTAKPGGIDVAVTVLNSRDWPSFKTCSDLNLPSEMVQCVESYKSYYHSKTKRRKLEWVYSLGTCHVIGSFDSKPIELVLSTYQAVVLCLFNNTERLTYKEIIEQLNLSDEDLVRVLLSLSCAKHRVLRKEPASKTIATTDVFEFNSNFTSDLRRIKVSLPPMGMDDHERKKVVEGVDIDRRYAIDACIMRIMKSRKVLPHQQLVSQCVEQLSRTFKPDIKMIKKRIEDLMIRDYLERDTENPNTFRYVA